MEFWLTLFESTLRIATPLILAAEAGFLSERCGIIDIALEGKMLITAFVAAAAAYTFHSVPMGILCALIAGIGMGALFGFFALFAKSEQIVTGVAINLLASGLTPFLCHWFFGVSGATPSLPITMQLGSGFLVAVACLVFILHLWSYYTPSGLWHSIAGEKPLALKTAGISTQKIRFLALLASGAISGLSGVSLSLFLSSGFSREMSAGRGFIAIAALILGKWKPIPAALACLLFASTEAIQLRWQSIEPTGIKIPVQLIQIMPYLVTLLVLAGFMGRARPPKALGNIN